MAYLAYASVLHIFRVASVHILTCALFRLKLLARRFATRRLLSEAAAQDSQQAPFLIFMPLLARLLAVSTLAEPHIFMALRFYLCCNVFSEICQPPEQSVQQS